MNHPVTRHDPFDDFFRGFFVRPVEMGSNLESPSITLDVKEQEKAYLVHAEMPGIKKEDIHVSIEGPVVSISAERKEEKNVREGERVLRSERYYGKVYRSFVLGSDIDEAATQAKYVDGILELSLAKKANNAAKRITVQ